jgi:hypothetical protein
MVDLLSTPGELAFSFQAAQGFMAIFQNVGLKGAKAIHLSRFKAAIVKSLTEIDEERKNLLLEFANKEGDELKPDEKGNAVFETPEKQKECFKAIEDLYKDTPIHVDIKNSQLKIAANQVYGVLTGDDCPDIGANSLAHDLVVQELTIALEKKD